MLAAANIHLKARWPITLLLFVGAACFVFWPQISGSGVFIGESDRLNSYLNIRLAEHDALQHFGRAANWDSHMFGGFSLAALHWMNPGRDPISWLLQYVPRADVFWALGFMPILLIIAATFTSFLYIRSVANAGVPAFVGALAYGLSVFSLHRAAQVDNAELTVVFLPLGLLFLRRADRTALAGSFAGLAVVMTALAFWGFLQEVAYTFLFFGIYALYRAAVVHDRGSRAAPIVVMAAASAVALTFSAPRLITISREVGLLLRTTTPHYYGYDQVLRFFHEGIYGRYFDEGRLLGHAMNLSEGLQLVSSSALPLFVCLGIARPRSCIETVGAILFYALLLVMVPPLGHIAGALHISVELYKFIFDSLILSGLVYFGIQYRKFRSDLAQGVLVPSSSRPADTTFHLFALTAVLFLILIPEGSNAVYYLFGRADFTHTRLSLLGLIPLCTLFAIYMAEIPALPIFARTQKKRVEFHTLALVGICSAVAAYAISGPWLSRLLPYNMAKLTLLSENKILPSAIVQIALTATLLGALAVLLTRKGFRNDNTPMVATIAIGVFVSVEILLYANLKVAGPQTWTYPVAFRGFNYLNVPPSVLRPPDETKLKAFDRVFEVENYRLVVLSDNTQYVGTNIPHIAEFWKARSIGGYGTGVAERLTRLPWPKGVQTLRTIDFTSMRDLDEPLFALLAFLNVKYLVSLTSAVYFNFRGASSTTNGEARAFTIGGVSYPLKSRDIDGIEFRFLENPVEVLPRHFLAEQVTENSGSPTPLGHPYFGPSAAENSRFLHIFVDQTTDLRRMSFSEGAKDGTVTAYDASGQLDVVYRGDWIEVTVTPSDRERFLVLNQTFNPNWKAYSGTTSLPVLPTNQVMSGVVIPPHTARIELKFEPFSSSRTASMLMSGAAAGLFGGYFMLRRRQRKAVG